MGEEAVRQGVRVLAVAVAAQAAEGEVGLVAPDGAAPVRGRREVGGALRHGREGHRGGELLRVRQLVAHGAGLCGGRRAGPQRDGASIPRPREVSGVPVPSAVSWNQPSVASYIVVRTAVAVASGRRFQCPASAPTELGVSRTPLREALITLEREGVITSERGKGFRFTPLSAQEFRDLSAIVATLEALALESSDPGHLAATAPVCWRRRAFSAPQAPHDAAIRAVTDEIMYAILGLSGQEYVDEYAVEVKAAQAEQSRQPKKFPKLRRSRRIRAR